MFVFDSRIAQDFALSQMSLCTHNTDHLLQNYISIYMNFFPRMAPHFFVMIHQVIWPSPGTLAVVDIRGRVPPYSNKLVVRARSVEDVTRLGHSEQDVIVLIEMLAQVSQGVRKTVHVARRQAFLNSKNRSKYQ